MAPFSDGNPESGKPPLYSANTVIVLSSMEVKQGEKGWSKYSLVQSLEDCEFYPSSELVFERNSETDFTTKSEA